MKKVTVGDVMTKKVVAVDEDAPFKEVVRLLHDHRVSGVPVIGGDGRLSGIVTEADLVFVEGKESARRNAFLDWFIHPKRLEEIEGRTAGLTARDLMTPDVITTRPETSVREAARAMIESGVKRLPVVDGDGRVLGVVSRRDLLTPYLRTDEELREEIATEVVERVMWLDPTEIHVEVIRGLVMLKGRLARRSEREILVELAGRVDGVLGVKDELTFAEDDRRIRPGPSWTAPLAGGLRS
ncbi:MAG TPA: CBS domain-containing protein [Actinomycetota bacterium]